MLKKYFLIKFMFLFYLFISCSPSTPDVSPSGGNPDNRIRLGEWANLNHVKIHGVYRSYKLNYSKGDLEKAHTGLKNGSESEKHFAIDRKYLQNGIETPTPGYRIPLSIQANNDDTKKGLYSIWDRGTSFIFPKAYTSSSTRVNDGNQRRSTAGLYVAIETDSPTITIKGKYLKTAGSEHTRSGMDIYSIDKNKNMKYKETILKNVNDAVNKIDTGASLGKKTKTIMFLFPNYNGFTELNFIFEKGATSYSVYPLDEDRKKPILAYGTSIDQGWGVRPGLAMWSLVKQYAKREVINVGVAGSAIMEYKMSDFLANIEASIFIINPGWNLTSTSFTSALCNNNGAPANLSNQEIINRTVYMMTNYRAAHPNTPIIIMTKLLKKNNTNTTSAITKDLSKIPNASTLNEKGYYYSREGALLKTAYEKLKNEHNIKDIYLIDQKVTDDMLDGPKVDYPNLIADPNLHYGEQGMKDSANFILQKIKEADPSIYNGGVIQ